MPPVCVCGPTVMELAVVVKISQVPVPAGPDMGYRQVLEFLLARCSGWCIVGSLLKGHFGLWCLWCVVVCGGVGGPGPFLTRDPNP